MQIKVAKFCSTSFLSLNDPDKMNPEPNSVGHEGVYWLNFVVLHYPRFPLNKLPTISFTHQAQKVLGMRGCIG